MHQHQAYIRRITALVQADQVSEISSSYVEVDTKKLVALSPFVFLTEADLRKLVKDLRMR